MSSPWTQFEVGDHQQTFTPGKMKPLKLFLGQDHRRWPGTSYHLQVSPQVLAKQSYDDVEEMVSNCVYSKFNLKTGECAAWSQSFLGIPGTGIIGGVVGNVSVDGFITTP